MDAALRHTSSEDAHRCTAIHTRHTTNEHYNGTATTWSNWHSLGGELTGPPSVIVDPEGMVHVFARGNDRSMWHKRRATLSLDEHI